MKLLLSAGTSFGNWTVKQLFYICGHFFISCEVAPPVKSLRGSECRSLLAFSFLTSSPEVAHLSEPRIFPNCITATTAMSYGGP